jgi:GNAT superfamily N-acetyltransferase
VGVPDDVTIEVVSPEDLAGDLHFWELYDTSFDESEREPRDVIVRSLAAGPGFALRARVSGRTIGLATAHVLDAPATTFLVYLAVDPQWRSKSVGSALFDATDSTGAARLADRGRRPAGMVWEVEDPDDARQQEARDVRLGRLRFFERLGGRLLAVPYVQPPVDGHTLVPMRLMFRPAPGQDLPDRAASATVVRAIFFEKYHSMNGIPAATLEALAATLDARPPQR